MALCWDQIITDELDVDERSRIVDRIKDAVKDIKDDRAVKGKQLAAIKWVEFVYVDIRSV